MKLQMVAIGVLKTARNCVATRFAISLHSCVTLAPFAPPRSFTRRRSMSACFEIHSTKLAHICRVH